jgi:predicted phage baseplate assembly protein
VEDLDASGPGDDHYLLDPINGKLTFGDGIRGRVPFRGEKNITASYHCGGGVRGNIDAHTISKLVDDRLKDLVKADNEECARGGEDAGTLEEAMAQAKRVLKRVTRAVTSSDYEHLALNTPGIGVARAKAIPRYHPIQKGTVPHVVSVIVVPQSPTLLPIPSAGFLKAVYRHLDEHRLLTTELFVLPPVYVMVSVKTTVVKTREHLAATVEAKVRERLNKFLHPTTGGQDDKGWPFGRPVYVSEIFETISGDEGVDYVKSVTLLKVGAKQTSDVSIPKHGLVYSAPHEIEVKEGSSV